MYQAFVGHLSEWPCPFHKPLVQSDDQQIHLYASHKAVLDVSLLPSPGGNPVRKYIS